MHDVQALIASDTTFADIAKRFPSAVVCPLAQGFALVPITDSLASELGALGLALSDSSAPLVSAVAPGVEILASQLSAAGPVAYVSTEFYGGAGGQATLVWVNGNIVFALSDEEDNRFGWPNTPVSQALRKMGVAADAGKDEFDTVGLGKHRVTERWAAAYA